MITGVSTRRLYESHGAAGFVQLTREVLGLTKDQYGRPVVQNPEVSPNEFSIQDLAEGIIGPDWYNYIGPQAGADAEIQRLREDEASGAIVPSSGLNVSAWSATVAGLLEARMLEAYRRPQYIADRLVTTMPTNLRSDRLVGRAALGDDAEEMNPGDPHPRAQFEERYVQAPDTKKRGLAVDVTREAVHFDQTNQVLQRAEQTGETLALRKEKRVFDVVLGINNVYNYRGTSYNTYLTSGNWVNSFTNELVNWTDIDEALELFTDMTDQETGERIAVNPTTILVMPSKLLTARNIINSTEIRTGDTTSETATQAVSANPVAGAYDIESSPIAYQRLTAADGGNIAANLAKKYWFFGDFKRAFAYMENWGLGVQRATPTDYMMLDHDLVLSVFANEMGAAAVTEPREVVRGISS